MESDKPFFERYYIKANVWIWILSYVGNFYWTHHFYNLLGAKYDDALRSNQHQSALLTVHMEASMVFEMNDMDLSNDGKLATIETKFKRSFVFAGERPVAVGAGNIHVSFKESIASS